MQNAIKNAGIYVRVSTERQANEGYSVGAQKANLSRFANVNNFCIYDVYADEGISGKNVEGRPAVKRLIKDIQDGKIDVVLIQKFDRLTRNITDTEDFIKLFQQYDVDVWSISDGKVDISNSNGKFMTLLKGLFAQYEREQTSERIKVAFKQKVEQGYTLCCGCLPYGYNREKGNKIIVINPEEAEVVRRIYQMYVDNMSFTEIARTLNTEGVPTKNAGKTIYLRKGGVVIGSRTFVGVWSPKAIRLILSNPVYIGKVRHNIRSENCYVGDGAHEPIISNEMWEKVREKVSKVKKVVRTNRPKDDVYFCGTLVCGVCGKVLTTERTLGRLKPDGTRNLFNAYRCVNREKGICTSRGMSHAKVEQAFIEYLTKNVDKFDNVNDVELKSNINDVEKNIETTRRIINNNNAKLREVMNLFMDSKIGSQQLDYMTKELRERIALYEENLIKLEKQREPVKYINKNKISRYIVDHWKLLTDSEKLAFLTDFVEKIVIVNRDTDVKKGKAEVLEVKFYD